MKPPDFAFHAAHSVDEAMTLLARLGPDAKLLAGGQSLGPMLNFRVVRPSHIIDIRRIPELLPISVERGSVRLGAAVTHAQIEDGAQLPASALGRALRRVASGIAYRAIRNRGTVGGSLAHADPSADWPLVMATLDASCEIVSKAGSRKVSARSFFVDQLETVLESGEILTAVIVDELPSGASFGYYKNARKQGEFAESLAAALTLLDEGSRFQSVDIWLSDGASVPRRMSEVEALLLGERWSEGLKSAVHAAALRSLADTHTDYGRYRSHLHAVSIIRAIDDAQRGARQA